ncbi:ribosomal assembly complex component [Zalerion maritima]|uniref:Pre-rRNA-processing protein IPI3 n=1 Tax=Zalerion maritima TaxID=339359 RepID=A0AAD5RFH7_9PEZI|nr:ribosomal assembly complex component [Zalerion maritima]
MWSEYFLSSVCGPPLSSNTAIAKDVGIYQHSLSPTTGIKATFKKSSCPANCLAASDTHIFAAQQDKAYVHVYSRLRGNQEAFVAFSDRIRSLLLVGDVLLLGTAEGKVLLWEFPFSSIDIIPLPIFQSILHFSHLPVSPLLTPVTPITRMLPSIYSISCLAFHICTGRLVFTPPIHIQAVSCMAATRNHLITGSDDSNLNVWSLSRLLELDNTVEPEPERTLSNHRAAITSLVASRSSNPHSSLCVSASRDKTCIVWNYRTGDALRTILFPATPLAAAMDPFPRLLAVSLEDRSIHLLDFFGDKPLIGSRAVESSSTMIKAPAPIAQAAVDQGPASCLGLSHDGGTLLSGHPQGQIVKWSLNGHGTELASLNSSVTNLIVLPPSPPQVNTRTINIVKPSPADQYAPVVQLEQGTMSHDASSLGKLVSTPGLPLSQLVDAVTAVNSLRTAGTACVGVQGPNGLEVKEEVELSHVLTQLGSFAELKPASMSSL